MTDLIKRLWKAFEYTEENGSIFTEAVDALEAAQAEYRRIKNQTCLCRFDKAAGEGEPDTVPSNECEYHRALRAELEQAQAEIERLSTKMCGDLAACESKQAALDKLQADNERLRIALTVIRQMGEKSDYYLAIQMSNRAIAALADTGETDND